jgi:hypothetical protein
MREIRLPGAIALIGLAALALAGCSGSMPEIDLPPAREVTPAREFPDLRDYRGALNCRPRQDGLTQVQLADLARDAQLDFVALADRAQTAGDYGIGGLTGETLIIPGASFGAGSDGGTIVALNLHDPINPDLPAAALIEAIHRQNGLAIAVAPERFASPADYALADGLEVYNLARAWDAARPVAIDLRAMFFGPDHFFTDLDLRPAAGLAAYDRMAAGGRVAMLAGVGGAKNLSMLGVKVGTLEQFLAVATVHVLADERDVAVVTDAIKRGHVYLGFDVLGYVHDFAFYAQSGGANVMMGDEAQLVPDLKLEVELSDPADSIAILRDGEPIASAPQAVTLEFQPRAPGAYRAEAWRRGHPWILSNPVYVR